MEADPLDVSATITFQVEERDGRYRACVEDGSGTHAATAQDPLDALRGALIVSQGSVDERIGYERGEA